MEALKYGLDLVGTIAALAAIICAVVSAVIFGAASEIPVAPLEIEREIEIESETSDKPDVAELQRQIIEVIRLTNSAIESVNEVSAKNARGAFWAMATAIPLSLVVVCTLALRLMTA